MRAEYKRILAILALGFALRVVGLGFGLPDLYHQDERIIMNHALSIGVGGWNTHFFIIPPFTIYLTFICQAVYFFMGKAVGAFATPASFALQFMKDPSSVYWLSRFVLGVLFGTATIWLVWSFLRRHFGDRAGWLAALFLAIMPMHVQHSHYIYADIPLTFATTGLFFILWALTKKPSIGNYILFGICLGWAAAIKYTALYFVPVFFLAHVLAHKRDSIRPKRIARLVLSGLSCIATFLVFAPYSLLDHENFLSQVIGQSGAESAVGWHHHATYSLLGGTGFVFMFFAVLGLWVMARKCSWRTILTVGFVAIFYVINGFFSQKFARYMMPLTPILALLAAIAIDELYIRYQKRRALVSVILVVLCAELAIPAIHAVLLFTREDTRTQCASWIKSNISQGTALAVDNRFYGPHLPPTRQQILDKYALLDASSGDLVRKKRLDMMLEATDFDHSYDLYQLITDEDQTRSTFLFNSPYVMEDADTLKRKGIQYVVIHYFESGDAPKRILGRLSDKMTLVRTFSPYRDPTRKLSLDPEATTAAPHLPAEILSRRSLGPYLEVYRVHD